LFHWVASVISREIKKTEAKKSKPKRPELLKMNAPKPEIRFKFTQKDHAFLWYKKIQYKVNEK